MSMGVPTNYGSLIQTRQTERQDRINEVKQQSYLDQVDKYGGIKLEYSKPQPRLDSPEPPPELKSIRERAPYVSNGQTIDTGRKFAPDPKSPLGKLLQTVVDTRDSDPTLSRRCQESLEQIRDGYTLMKSPPEYDYRDYAQQLRDKAQELRQRVENHFSHGEGEGVSVGDLFDDDVKLGPRMKEMLEQTAKQLEELAGYVEDKPDPRPTMKSVGHFKSLETQGAIDLVEKHLTDKNDQLMKAISRNEDTTQLQGQIDLLRDTKTELEARRDTFKGLNDDEPQWKEKAPLDKNRLNSVAGEKPGIFAGLLKKLGMGAWGQAIKSMKEFVTGEPSGKMPPLTHPKMGETDMLSMFLRERLNGAGCTTPSGQPFTEKEMKHEIGESHVKVLSTQQDWDVIDKTFGLTINGETKEFRSILTPHNQIGTGPNLLEGGQGVCCHDGKSKIAVNVWQSELKNDKDETLFRQVRTGVNCAYEIEDETERKQVNKDRAMQLLMVHLDSDPKLRGQLLEQKERVQDGNEAEPIVVRNLWISHLTPDPIRPITHGQNENERMMSLEQHEAMMSLSNNGEPIEISLGVDGNGEEIKVKVKYEPIMFSVGVNTGAVAKDGWDLTGGWSFAKEQFNEPSMKVLLGENGITKGGEIGGWVGDAIKANNDRMTEARKEIDELHSKNMFDDDLDLDDKKENEDKIRDLEDTIAKAKASNERIRALSTQIQDIWVSGEYMTQGEDPYKLTSRLGVLGFEIGAAITSNCKSNKDRNSYGDVHMKDLSIQMHEKGELRAPNQPRSREEQLNLRTLARESGNSELQHLNVGGAGYKLSGVGKVFEEQGLGKDDVGYMGVGPFTAT